jgi:glycine/sarcosine N-methyltransferase
MTVPLYDRFADYDRFIQWEKRLAYELPLIERILSAHRAQRILDVACGTGQHAIALASQGYEVTGADLSQGMIEQAKANAAAQANHPQFLVAGFGELASKTESRYDALLCLGSSLPHVLTEDTLREALADFATVLRPGGSLLIQNRNMDAVVAQRARWMAPQATRDGEREWLFLRFYDFNADGNLTFNVIALQRTGQEPWQQRIDATTLRPWLRDELVHAIREAGFEQIICYGDMNGSPWSSDSTNLVISADRRPI